MLVSGMSRRTTGGAFDGVPSGTVVGCCASMGEAATALASSAYAAKDRTVIQQAPERDVSDNVVSTIYTQIRPTLSSPRHRHSRESGNPCSPIYRSDWIPTFGGMTFPRSPSFPRKRESMFPHLPVRLDPDLRRDDRGRRYRSAYGRVVPSRIMASTV